MDIIPIGDSRNTTFAARGTCPHCLIASFFKPLASQQYGGKPGIVSQIAQCQSCNEVILVLAKTQAILNAPYAYLKHHPNRINDRVDQSIPKKVADDFAEALRCFNAESYKATVTMCRRALQGSCLDLKAEGKWLVDQIDNLADRGVITAPLKEMAHQVRTIGNIGAHPAKDGLEDVLKSDAEDIIEFTREHFDHVYKMPAKLAAMKGKGTAKA